MHFLSPAILEFVANGRVQGPEGNRDPHMAPHGVYPCVADDSWIAITCATEEQWRSLSDLMGRPELARDSRFAMLDARIVNQDALDHIIADWTSNVDANVNLNRSLSQVAFRQARPRAATICIMILNWHIAAISSKLSIRELARFQSKRRRI